ncbi:tripartite tricarboxylate transporter permease [Acidaminococcus sp. NSJ-142]|uniref:tripartite tricarboxylate transporter permease n=1 Tax=Acidaminococcus TaxID=904 RepID=UPI000CF9FCE8|nr:MULTISPECIES: tripartite tricarboxylate transporter permease [Acidaminococcus]MCD2435324.1 tripartite tricarboxylate transporter permease [Acidaminococcus hominis]
MVLEGALSVLNPTTLFIILVGVIVGIIFGSIPGLTSTMAVALCLPITFGMSPLDGISMLIALYVGGTSGGLISAILLKIPGTPSSVATTFDGAPMAEKGEGGRALGIGIVYSFLGTVLSIGALFFIAPPLAKLALKFGPIETFSICVFALTMIAAMISDNPFKAVMAGVVGVVISLFGISDITGSARFTFGFSELENGFSQLPVMIGLFATAEILKAASEGISDKKGTVLSYKIKGFGFTWQEFKDHFVNFIRSALIGIGIGILPGIGGATSNIVAYSVARQQSKHPEKYGTGYMGGIVASETSNNASIGGALIPLLTLGIPGDTVTAIILGGLMLHGIVPGPLLFQNNGELVYGLFAGLIVATFIMLIVEFGGIRAFVRVLDVPKYILFPIIFVLCIVGTYGTNHSMFDVWTSLIFGVIGFFMSKYGYPQAPMILGLVLGQAIEQNLLRGMQYTDNNFWAFFESPIAAVFLSISIFVILWAVYKQVKVRFAH